MTPTSSGPDAGVLSTRPRFSLITAVYNVGRYLPDFIDSIERQTFPLSKLEVIAVDDGSTDNSLEILRAWATRRPRLVTVLSKDRGGQASARNLGIEHAMGEWLSFPDPDDRLEHDYLDQVDRFIRSNPHAAMLATNRIILNDATGELTESHPLRAHFERDQLVDIERFPDFFHGSAPAAFLRAETIERLKLRFDLRVRPNFEDGHFCSRYLLESNNALVGFVKSARYHYRKRADNSSTLQRALLDPDRFLSSPRYGYLDLLQRGADLQGDPPEWLQNFILYELSFYFKPEDQMASVASAAQGDVAQEFVGILREIAGLLSPHVVEAFGVSRFDLPWRHIMLHAFGSQPWTTAYAIVEAHDPVRERARVAYHFVGEAPHEEILIDGLPFKPVDGKIRAIEYWGHQLLFERLVWVPSNGSLRVLLNGEPLDLRGAWPADPKVSRMYPRHLRRRRRPRRPSVSELRERAWDLVCDVARAAIARSGRSVLLRWRYRDAWVLLDRVHDAGDNAERLFRYLRATRSELNAWFVIDKGSRDWDRLRAEGKRRVLPYGSFRWFLLMLNCKYLISSHADKEVMSPRRFRWLGPPRWRFTFLQHGVIRDDISRWLNPKEIDLMVTSTPDEHQSIVGDYTPYVLTTHEAKMVGLPRFDRLLELATRTPTNERKRLLICPTWRHWLSEPAPNGGSRPGVKPEIYDSEFVQQWLSLLRDDRMHRLAKRNGMTITFLPHPNLGPAAQNFNLPPYVEVLQFEGEDAQRVMAATAVMITDYSSMAFNLAFIERPTVYFQFDKAKALGGGHIGRFGYFDYAEHGFGPVTESVDEVLRALDGILGNGWDLAPYLARMRATFPLRDGRCCERTVAAIEAMGRPPSN